MKSSLVMRMARAGCASQCVAEELVPGGPTVVVLADGGWGLPRPPLALLPPETSRGERPLLPLLRLPGGVFL
jgi:hypothetical protein